MNHHSFDNIKTYKIPLYTHLMFISILLLSSLVYIPCTSSESLYSYHLKGITQQFLQDPLDDTLDQRQTFWNGAIAAAYPDMLAQSFIPTENILTRVHILMYKTENPQHNISVSIRDTKNGSDLTSIHLSPDMIPTSRTWVEFDFPNISVNPYQTYYIIWQPLEPKMSYLWYGYDNKNFDSYQDGEAWLYTDGQWNTEGFVMKDWCFKTYSKHSSQAPNTPQTPTGPGEGLSWIPYHYETFTTDPEEDDIRYGWDWDGDDIVDEWTSYYPSGTPINVSHYWAFAGTYHVKVKAEDHYGIQSPFSLTKSITIINNPPNIPNTPEGPTFAIVQESIMFTTSTSDTEGDMIRYGWDWDGDDIVDEWTNFHEPSETVTSSHMWNQSGTYYVKVKAEDDRGARSEFSNSTRIILITIDNDPPAKPDMPQGPTVGLTGVSYSYTSSSTDPNGDQVYYLFDWDDGSSDEWMGPYESGQPVTISHIWNTKGSFYVKVKAKDDAGEESVWSDPLPLTLPKNRMLCDIFDSWSFIYDFYNTGTYIIK